MNAGACPRFLLNFALLYAGKKKAKIARKRSICPAFELDLSQLVYE